ncbi:MAG: cytochrome c-type biogenesis protein CcmH [Alphaproteobacteria bacterium]|tara:strand:- start:1356 stop:1733 length:378 start_codon:yes stop_codon:yes gene_type:complete
MNKFRIFLILLLCLSSKLEGVEPNEMLKDPKLEEIAKDIGKNIRCLVCQNEDIENSNADIARDLRVLVRKKLMNGEKRKDIISYIHSRYGDYVLFNPPLRIDTVALWIVPVLFFILLVHFFFRKS